MVMFMRMKLNRYYYDIRLSTILCGVFFRPDQYYFASSLIVSSRGWGLNNNRHDEYNKFQPTSSSSSSLFKSYYYDPNNNHNNDCRILSSSLRQQKQKKKISSSCLAVYFRANQGIIEEEEFYRPSSPTDKNTDDDEAVNGLSRSSVDFLNGNNKHDPNNDDDDDEQSRKEKKNRPNQNQQRGSRRISTNQAKALQNLISSFPYPYENIQHFYDLNTEQWYAIQQLVSSFATTATTTTTTTTAAATETDTSTDVDNVSEESSMISDDDDDDDDDDMELSPKQQEALSSIKEGHNVFITGVAGTGKSLVLRKALEYFQNNKYSFGSISKNYVAVAPTGPTALALGGQTIHSFSGIGIPRTQDNFKKTRTNKENAKRWLSLDVMILDECSMISGEFMDRLSDEVSLIRQDPRPFGGIQLILCGDFLQLPPIKPSRNTIQQEQHAMEEKGQNIDDLFLNRGYCFQSHAWYKANFDIVELDVVFRQKNKEYVKMLQRIREGRVGKSVLEFFQQCQRPLPSNKYGIRPTMLHSRNKDVSYENRKELSKLPGNIIVYQAEDTVEPEPGSGPWVRKQLKANPFFKTCIAEKELELKLGAEVMLVKNLPGSRLFNGSRGKVVNFRTLPKSKQKAMQTTTKVDDDDGTTEYPVVQFVNGVRKVITPELFESRLVGVGKCKRRAIPLKLAWAITTHKAQGLTLDYVVADLGGVFGEAQSYVALSRATDQEGLELRNFTPNKVRSNPIALEFYRNPSSNRYPAWDGTIIGSRSNQQLLEKKKNRNDDGDGNDDGNGDATSRSIEAVIFSKKYTVVQLKEMLKDMGLKTTGRKPELISRLLKAGASP